MLEDCPEEKSTQHYDESRSLGVIQNEETIVVAALKTQDAAGGKLSAKVFPTRRLRSKQASIFRARHITQKEFDAKIIEPSTNRGNDFQGVATIKAETVRSILVTSKGKLTCSAFCVIDYVVPEDHDAHGVITFSDGLQRIALNEPELGFIRNAALGELLARFSPLNAASNVAWKMPPADEGAA